MEDTGIAKGSRKAALNKSLNFFTLYISTDKNSEEINRIGTQVIIKLAVFFAANWNA
jgi:hypothetical protein